MVIFRYNQKMLFMKTKLLFCFYLISPLAVITAFPAVSYAQEHVNADLVKYQFSVQDVNDAASAKEMTDYIRPLFNTEEKRFEYFPWFNTTSGQFEFVSSVHVSETQLSGVLDHFGLVLLSFSSVANAESNSSKQ